jgi:hypothetical protein
MQHKGNLTISRYSSGTIAIKIEDDNGSRILVAELTPHDFAMALTGLAWGACQYTVTSENAGKIRETKVISVAMEQLYRTLSDEEKVVILSPHEVDGWKANASDLGNHHKMTKNGYTVMFTRFVEKE